MSIATENSPLPAASRRDVVLHSLIFIAGFTLVFVAAGATASALGALFAEYRIIITRVFGIVVILLGLNMLGLFRLPFLAMDKRLRIRRAGTGHLTSFFVGIGFAAGWSPCIGPILAAVLGYASESKTVAQGVWLLFVYSMGLALPFLATAFALQRVLPFLNRIKRFLPAIEVVAGLIVITMGVVLVTNSFLRFTGWLYKEFPALANVGTGPEASGDVVSIGAVFVAGLVSFISPCVLPLVPVYISFLTGQSIESLVSSYQREPAPAAT
ncbi:MAG TPA: cytochrome c biogenesis protein CcdA [Candidatus Eremiobacteraceae bacterium]|nr:cytochrome c biogenesis protein CcdA [Candidatus Eremiobacteraceae bacterium]